MSGQDSWAWSPIPAFTEARRVRPVQQPADSPLLRRSLADLTSTTPPIPVTDVGPSRPLSDVILDRRSLRQFHGPPTAEQIGLLVARAGLVRKESVDRAGVSTSYRAAPSAGARHPFEIAVAVHDVTGLTPGLWVLDAQAAVLRPGVLTKGQVEDALGHVTEALHVDSIPPAVAFVVADPRPTLTRYPRGISLLWRESGALLMMLHLLATDLDLGSCIVGTVGALCHDDRDPNATIDLGAVAIGAPTPTRPRGRRRQ